MKVQFWIDNCAIGDSSESDLRFKAESELTELKKALEDKTEELQFLKLILADKEIELAKQRKGLSSSGPPPSNTTLVAPSYANAARKGRAVLVAKVAPNSDTSSVNRHYFDNLLGLKDGGLPVSRFRRSESSYVIEFPSIEQRNRAHDIISSKSNTPFEKLSNPEQQFPLLAKFNGIDCTNFSASEDSSETKEEKDSEVLKLLSEENPEFEGQFSSLRVLHRIPDSNSFLVRLCLKTAAARNSLLRRCTISLEGANHRVDKVDPNREVRRCTKCQSHKHSTKRCQSASFKRAICAADHSTKDCDHPKDAPPKCCNCGQGHKTSDFSCKDHVASVAAYLARNKSQ